MNCIRIDSVDDPRLAPYTRMTEVMLANLCQPDPLGIFIAESPQVIERALDQGYEPQSYLVDEKQLKGALAALLVRTPDVPVFVSDETELVKITGFHLTRGVLCAMKRRELPSVVEVLRGARRIAVLERIMNPTNAGAIFRSAAALGMDAVLFTPGSCDPLYRRAARVSMGTVFQVPWTFIGESPEDWPAKGIAQLKELGFKTAAMALHDNTYDINAPEIAREKKLAVILGTEGEGLLQETIDACDYCVKIPMHAGVDSLNVSNAAAIAFWELGKYKQA